MEKKHFKYILILMLAIVGLVSSCRDDVGDNIYTAKGKTVAQYIREEPETFSMFYEILQKTGMEGLLDSYGLYTCFAPNNNAIIAYVDSSEYATLDEIPVDTLKNMVLYQIIEGDSIFTANMVGDRLSTSNMAGDDLICKIESGVSATYIINGSSKILERDLEATNGVIHVIDAVIKRDRDNTAEKINNEEYEGRYSIFYEALVQTGIASQLTKYLDSQEFSYERVTDKAIIVIPRYYKYTLFVESNEVYENEGIYNFEDLKRRYDDGKGDITSPTNGLYRFVAYHCLDRIYDETDMNFFVKQDGYEIVETMCENTLLQMGNFTGRMHLNRFIENGVVINEGAAFTTDNSRKNIMSNNGMIHEIESILEIPDQVRYFNKKMRFNVASFLPELMNGNFRGKVRREFPRVFENSEQYFKNLTMRGEGGYVIPVYDYNTYWIRHQYDEILIGMGYVANEQCTDLTVFSSTRYDVTLTLPPIPPGKWEIRFGFTSNQYRGMAQLYFDGVPSGVPLNLGPGEDYGTSGMDEETARKVMYNNSFMPFPSNITNESGTAATYTTTDRMRRIIGIYDFSEMKKHTLRFKTVEPGQLSLNFVEWIPVDQIENEGTD
ncbi:fasciclin domain-containing protein [Dysgonomonas sp. 216]|uniref:fasciclin domain-containing protein n=1 Tax=Dysgonomonas sp. 216 TaxID=2302934 RepID=UPI0013D5B92F|nr:fasciclin domain-containing protein [Dysgonomonas sp. 216]NDW18957.1 fasciclin domain-containing protein [Dysgonomonas sp. 216]